MIRRSLTVMDSTLSHEEFERLQSQLIDLRTVNYTLEEKCRKREYENSVVIEKYDHLEKEYLKCIKTINKSKKTKDVELLIQENDNLQCKLQSQEDDFRLQNETLLQELSALVTNNEKLESRLADYQVGVLAGSPESSYPCDRTSGLVDNEAFNKLHNDNVVLQDRLQKKQESFLALQSEKEALFNENRNLVQNLSESVNTEILQLKEQNQRLQTQLTNSLDKLKEAKEQSNYTSVDLEHQLREATTKFNDAMQEKSFLFQQQSTEMECELNRLLDELAAAKSESDQGQVLVRSLEGRLSEYESLLKDAESRSNQLIRELEEVTELSTKRRLIIDEMASELKSQAAEFGVKTNQLSEEYALSLDRLSEELNQTRIKVEDLKDQKLKASAYRDQIVELENSKLWLDNRVKELEENLENTKCLYEKTTDLLRQEKDREMEEMLVKHKTEIGDMLVQLEMVNALNVEHREEVERLKQEIQDSVEEKKIQEKKNLAMVKDVKRQLHIEKKRTDKLQEKLQELQSNHNLNESLANQSRHSIDMYKTLEPELLNAETSSISSWSMMSGDRNENNRGSNGSSVHNDSPNLLKQPEVEQEHSDLLIRIGELQQEKWVMEEKISHLEESSSAMADDLVNKTAIIQFYCMDGKPDHVSQSRLGQEPDKTAVRRLVALIKNQGEESHRDMTRKMQRMLEETLTKNMHMQQDLESMSREIQRLTKLTREASSTTLVSP